MDKMKIAVILGTTRPGARSEVYAKLVKKVGEGREDIEVMYVDPKELNLPGDGMVPDPEFTRISAEADGFFIVTPEYNHSFPGSLKRLLDSEYENYRRKPVLTAGVSGGPFGGVRAIKSLLPVLQRIQLVPCFVELPNPNINDLIDENETISDAETIDRINKGFDELVWFAQALKQAR
jgi:NAD(P)H-dependent FMN reductase